MPYTIASGMHSFLGFKNPLNCESKLSYRITITPNAFPPFRGNTTAGAACCTVDAMDRTKRGLHFVRFNA